MKSSNRWLAVFGIILGVLVITAVILVLTLKADTTLLPENTPEGVVQRYFVAMKNGDYEGAYEYLSAGAKTRIPYPDWKPSYYVGAPENTWQVTIGKAVITGVNAKVPVVVDRFNAGGGFNNAVYSQNYTFELALESGAWKITQPDYIYFIY